MRTIRWTLFLAAGCMLLAPGVAPADVVDDDVQEQLAIMQQRLGQMEDRLRSTNEKLAEAEARAARGGGGGSLPSFFERLEFSGWVAASYHYNFESPDGRDLRGFNAGGTPAAAAAQPASPGNAFAAYPFHPDSNSFSLDQLWMEIEHPVSEAHRAGFRADFLFGKTGDILNNGVSDGFSGSDEDFHLYQGYIQYLAPIGEEGVTFKFGKFATLIGAEVAQSPYNFNITRGHLYNLFQPITHVGILASTEFGEGMSASLGFVNETRSFPAADVDVNNNKAALWSLGWTGETVAASFNGTWGDADSGQGVDTHTGDKELILDWILSWEPNDEFSGYINADYIESDNSNTQFPLALPGVPAVLTEFEGYGVAVAGRYAINERLGLALRGEWVELAFTNQGGVDPDLRMWGLTSTMDYALTDHLKVRGELRWDVARQGNDGLRNVFFNSNSSGLCGAAGLGCGNGQRLTEDDQFTGGVEVIYSF